MRRGKLLRRESLFPVCKGYVGFFYRIGLWKTITRLLHKNCRWFKRSLTRSYRPRSVTNAFRLRFRRSCYNCAILASSWNNRALFCALYRLLKLIIAIDNRFMIGAKHTISLFNYSYYLKTRFRT